MILRSLQSSEMDLIWQQISRRELITQNYIQKQQKLELVDCIFDVQNWDSYHLENDPPKLKQLFEQGSIFIGAFDASEKLVGVSVVSKQVITDYPHA